MPVIDPMTSLPVPPGTVYEPLWDACDYELSKLVGLCFALREMWRLREEARTTDSPQRASMLREATAHIKNQQRAIWDTCQQLVTTISRP